MAKANKLDLEEVDYNKAKESSEYLKVNPLNKIPSFEGSDGYILTEAMAIAIYGKLATPPRHLAQMSHFCMMRHIINSQLSLSEDTC